MCIIRVHRSALGRVLNVLRNAHIRSDQRVSKLDLNYEVVSVADADLPRARAALGAAGLLPSANAQARMRSYDLCPAPVSFADVLSTYLVILEKRGNPGLQKAVQVKATGPAAAVEEAERLTGADWKLVRVTNYKDPDRRGQSELFSKDSYDRILKQYEDALETARQAKERADEKRLEFGSGDPRAVAAEERAARATWRVEALYERLKKERSQQGQSELLRPGEKLAP